jgi:hypothetical protein
VRHVPPELRDYRLLKLTGRFPQELAHLRAWDLDYALAIDEVVRGQGRPSDE